MTPRPPEKAPKHLKPQTRRWWAAVEAAFEFEDHHRRLLTLAGEHWDRCAAARLALAEHGLTFVDKHGHPRERPEVKIAKDSSVVFARMLRELRLDADQLAEDQRVPRLIERRA